MATSSFDKVFKVTKKSVLAFSKNMSKDVKPTMDTNFKSRHTNNKQTIKNIANGIFSR